ncbi:DUF4837 family protein [Dolichospermum sp. ST_sed3]|nr:DUF4837 family protein [Dolichospermum sp. ST_sed3]
MKYILISFCLSVLIFSSCSDSKNTNLPQASGLTGDIFLIMDSTQWKGPLGKILDSLFSAEMAGLPRAEPIYKIKWIDPRKLNSVLKQRRNLIFAVTFDQRSAGANVVKKLFTKESLAQIKDNPDFFSQNDHNIFSKGQEVLFLFSSTENQLIQHIRINGNKLIGYFDQKERERLTSSLFKSNQLKNVSRILRKDFQCDMKVPFGYQFVMSNEEFLWVRQINPKDDKDIFISRKKYTSQEQFKRDSLINWRDEICQKYLYGDPERSDTYLVTETNVDYKPVLTKEISFHKKFAVEMRGLWRTNNFVMGGPFLSYTMVDQQQGIIYYIEGFTYSPGKDQREIMRELETILYTFKISSELPAPPK